MKAAQVVGVVDRRRRGRDLSRERLVELRLAWGLGWCLVAHRRQSMASFGPRIRSEPAVLVQVELQQRVSRGPSAA